MSNNTNKGSVERGVRQQDVEAMVTTILQDDSMILPVPNAVAKVIYQSTVKLSFNMFYKAIGNLEGMDLSSSRELHLDRTFNGTGGNGGTQQRSWQSFQGAIDSKPLERMASQLLKNEAVNVTVIPDAVEKEIYFNCLKLIFWVLHIITSNVKVTFCGHNISLGMAPAATINHFVGTTTRGGGGGASQQEAFINKINSFMVNPKTIQEFSQQATSLLRMDGFSPEASNSGNRSSGVKNGLAFLKSSMNKVQKEMIKQLNVSLYGVILAVVDDLLSCTKIEVMNDQISLRVGSSYSSSQGKPTRTHNNNRPRQSHLGGSGVDDVSLAVEASMTSLEFEQERAILQRRFQQWSPEQRALILKDLSM